MDDKEVKEFSKVVMPMIRRVIPSMIAADLLGTQPMGNVSISFQQGTEQSSNGEIAWHWVQLPYTDSISKIFKIRSGVPEYDDGVEYDDDLVCEWVRSMFGEPSEDRWLKDGRKYYFRDKEDVSVFLLRWRGA